MRAPNDGLKSKAQEPTAGDHLEAYILFKTLSQCPTKNWTVGTKRHYREVAANSLRLYRQALRVFYANKDLTEHTNH